MLIVTSLAPRLRRLSPTGAPVGDQYQRRCVERWLGAGARVRSVNMPDEIEPLARDNPEVEFVAASGADAGAGRRLPLISELIGAAEGELFAIANSDVRFEGDASALEQLFDAARGGAVFAHRREKAMESLEPGPPYLYGYDFLMLDPRFLTPRDLEGFTIGAPWWDYLALYLLAARRVPLKLLETPIISHLTHAQVWSEAEMSRSRSLIARRLRLLAEDEGPVAALLAWLLSSLEEGTAPAYAMRELGNAFATLLGVAVVNVVRERCTEVLWFDGERGAGASVAGRLNSAPYIDARRVLMSVADASAPAEFWEGAAA